MGRKPKLPEEARKYLADNYKGHEELGAKAYARELNANETYRKALDGMGVSIKITEGVVRGAVPKFKERDKRGKGSTAAAAPGLSGPRCDGPVQTLPTDAEPAKVADGLRRKYDSLTQLADDLDKAWHTAVEERKDYMPQMRGIDLAAESVGGAAREYRKSRKADAAVEHVRKQMEELKKRIAEAETEMAALDPSNDAKLALDVYNDPKVLRRIYSMIDRTAMPYENKEILKGAVASKLEELASQTDGNGVAAAARKTLEAAQNLIPKATVEKKKRKGDKERVLEDDKAFVKQSIEMIYESGADPTPYAITERANRLGYPLNLAEHFAKNDALNVLEKEGVVYRAGFDEKSSHAVYLPKGQKSHNPLREKPISMEELKGRAKDDGRTPLSDTKECEIKVEGDHVMVDGARIPKEYIDKKVRGGRAANYLQVFSAEIERFGGDLGRDDLRVLGHWMAKEMWPDADESFYSVEVVADCVKVARRTINNETRRQTAEDIRKEGKKKGVSE